MYAPLLGDNVWRTNQFFLKTLTNSSSSLSSSAWSPCDKDSQLLNIEWSSTVGVFSASGSSWKPEFPSFKYAYKSHRINQNPLARICMDAFLNLNKTPIGTSLRRRPKNTISSYQVANNSSLHSQPRFKTFPMFAVLKCWCITLTPCLHFPMNKAGKPFVILLWYGVKVRGWNTRGICCN